MINAPTQTTNQAKTIRLRAMLDELLRQTLQRGFHGTAAIEIAVQDGTIQNIRRRVEQMER
ncbi:MAG: hypothetical protein JNK76_14465 [Planctomycetales bacterium]|nr:hypothetical protein [Planctomycetales bacterium]MBN8625023.1 hypothetical protein [Planctomycetota bacterium]